MEQARKFFRFEDMLIQAVDGVQAINIYFEHEGYPVGEEPEEYCKYKEITLYQAVAELAFAECEDSEEKTGLIEAAKVIAEWKPRCLSISKSLI
ncbi:MULTISPECIES: hypothetical protein [Lactobacillales]|uniref:hypothetical protein n=1 Tax=Lactobacillales TaxID=186826 RepID=UPI002FC9B389